MVKKITKRQANHVKLSYSAQKLQSQTILFPYKLCITKKRTYVNKLKFFRNGTKIGTEKRVIKYNQSMNKSMKGLCKRSIDKGLMLAVT